MSGFLFPAPWSVDGYQSQGGGYVCEVRDSLGSLVVAGVDKGRAEAMVDACNGGSSAREVQKVKDAYQGAIDALNSDLLMVRGIWHKEVSALHAQLDLYRTEIAALKKSSGLLL